MYHLVDQVLGIGRSERWMPEGYELSYSKAHVLLAWSEDGTLMGWALVRHPQRRLAIKIPWNPWRKAYGGRRSDFNVYVKSKFRQRGVAKDLLLVAYNNFGRLDAYPHDKQSCSFYSKMKKFVTANVTNGWRTPEFHAREIF